MQNNLYLGVNMTPRLYFQIALLLVISAYVLYSYRKLERPYQFLGLVIIITLISEIGARILSFEIRNSNPPYHILAPILLFLFSLIYLDLIKPSKIFRLIIIIFTSIFVGLSLIITLHIQSIMEFPTYAFSLLSVVIVTYSLLLSRKMLLAPIGIRLVKQADFWLNLGNFIFYALSFFILAFMEFIINNELDWVLDIIYLLNILLYGFYFIAIRLNHKRK